ncbi:urease accessory protein UreE [Leptolyngbya sp. FACHB-402]|nr:urease accessory protein UreE [Leptolyngbya sp. FACHB-161]MBD2372267.1 urease accessory protein UreE [Leptolyngbya sp. FACHB-238]MBD2396690.1 urease accessory protein UreE [Leptolyngbya sp. FACHB-239]MBD2403213.1 urease accessory protein UreE [Leptolyngbya sp. FACHB-402]MBN8561861.1 urease accessory protein UreE [Leptolyngbya sp. UWPOB_LEPTO1]
MVTPTFVRRIPPQSSPDYILSLTAEERTRSRFLFQSDDGQEVYLNLPRGTTLKDGDWLESDQGKFAKIQAKPEPVLTITTSQSLDLLQAAYHLGNRHVPLEISSAYLRLSPDPVLQDLLEHRGLQVKSEIVPFQPESGAYGHSH